MSQEKFNDVYKGVYGVVWNETFIAMCMKTNGL